MVPGLTRNLDYENTSARNGGVFFVLGDPPMSELRARQVWHDCHIALARLEEDLPPPEWRVAWVGALALLRAVGNVLREVDGQQPTIKDRVRNQFAEWEKGEARSAVFWEFIKKSRDLALKEYTLSVWDEPTIDVFYGVDGMGAMSSLDSALYRPITNGYGEGEDARDVYREALEWWDRKLSEIEDG